MTTQPNDMNKQRASKVAIVGAGVSGLAAAYKLKSYGVNVTVFEADGRTGGKLKSVSRNGFVWDNGANTMAESEVEVQNLLDDLSMRQKQLYPLSQHKRYVVRNGVPILIPNNPIELIGSSILSTQAKLQIILEPFLWKKRNVSRVSDSCTSESVGKFIERHFGKEVVDYLIDPFVAGTSGADPESLSAPHFFPELMNLENRYGSIIAGSIRANLESKTKQSKETKALQGNRKRLRGSFSFLGGMQALTDSLCSKLENNELKLESKVLSLSYSHPEHNMLGNWSILSASDEKKHKQKSSYDAVVITVPTCSMKEINFFKNNQIFPLNFLPEVVYMPLSVIITAFRKENVKRHLEGFGVLVPSKEQQNGLKTLGTLFSSAMFPDRAPNDLHLYTTFVGGSRNMELAKSSADELKQIVANDLNQLLGAEGEPVFFNHFFWSKAFPLYGKDYGCVLKAIDEMESNLPGFFYAGNHRDGLSVGKSIASGYKAANRVISYLEAQSSRSIE